MTKKLLALLLACLLLVSLFAGCGKTEEPAPAKEETPGESAEAPAAEGGEKRDDVNIYCEGVWTDLDPHGTGCTTYTNMYLLNQMYEPLASVADNGDIVPVLATEWSINEDGTVYTFKLREGVKFHNGDEMTAEDVVFSLNRAFEAAPLETFSSFIDKAEVVDASGSVAKLANQVIVNLTIAAVSEAMVLAARAGADPEKVFDAIRGGLAGSAVLEAKVPMMLDRNFKPGGKISINRKDIRNVLDAAHSLDVPVPMSAQLYEIFQTLKVQGRMDEDHSAIVRYFEQLAGVTVQRRGERHAQ